MIQKKEELEKWHETEDPWDYNSNKDDLVRRDILLSEIPEKEYANVLDIGCGQGFITKELPGVNIFGVDISQKAIDYAIKVSTERLQFKQGSIFEIDKLFNIKFDLIIVTGVLYPQYIGNSSRLIYLLIDKILNENGILISVHINEWYKAQFPYLKTKQLYYDYRQYTHNLEIYSK
jgi:2-polyprenyl-3-methyl-5-hydroxy-6-metoxy-1,4-benzoquinol methylase